MNDQQKGWCKRFLEMGDAAEFIVQYVLKDKSDDDGSMSNEDYGAYMRAKAAVHKNIEKRVQEMKIELSR